MIYSALVRPFLFSLDAETAHNSALGILKKAGAIPGVKNILSGFFRAAHPALQCDLFGCHFENPVGLAAGLDKNCELSGILPGFGFGFIECGTVTAHAQPGNPKPRIFRLVEREALVNHLGFNNCGAEAVSQKLARATLPSIPLGINIGKSKITPLENAVHDYLTSFELLYPFASYFAINVSSPNTPRLRELQKDLGPLLAAIQEKNQRFSHEAGKSRKPLFVKVSPDLEKEDLAHVVENCMKYQVTGIIATNTTIDRAGLPEAASIEGGASGKPLAAKALSLLRAIRRQSGKKLVLIGVGGIFNGSDAYERIKAGASLIQIYTAWIYQGPGLIRAINQDLVSFLKRDGLKHLSEAVGVEA